MELVRPRRNGGEISHFRHAETTSFHRPNLVQIDVPRKFPKPFHEYARHDLPRLTFVFYATRWYATAGIKRFRLINVAPNYGIWFDINVTINPSGYRNANTFPVWFESLKRRTTRRRRKLSLPFLILREGRKPAPPGTIGQENTCNNQSVGSLQHT